MPELLLPRRADTVAVACDRAEVMTRAAGWEGGDVIRATLAIGEAVGNAVEHGGHAPDDPVRIRLSMDDGALTVCVNDGGGGPDPAALDAARLPNDPMATSGRGLFILQRVADEAYLDDDGGLCVIVRPRT